MIGASIQPSTGTNPPSHVHASVVFDLFGIIFGDYRLLSMLLRPTVACLIKRLELGLSSPAAILCSGLIFSASLRMKRFPFTFHFRLFPVVPTHVHTHSLVEEGWSVKKGMEKNSMR